MRRNIRALSVSCHPDSSQRITDKIDQGDLSEKPGWVRISVHPTMTDEEIIL